MTMQFQIIDVVAGDMPVKGTPNEWIMLKNGKAFNPLAPPENLDDYKAGKYPSSKSVYSIYLMGLTENGRSVSVRINDYYPTLLIKINALSDVDTIASHVLDDKIRPYIMNLPKNPLPGQPQLDVVHRKVIGPSGGVDGMFVRLRFEAQSRLKYCKNVLDKAAIVLHPTEKLTPHHYYQDYLKPVLRFFNHTGIEPFGWVSIDLEKCKVRDDNSRADMAVVVKSFKDVVPMVDRIGHAPIKVMSFDIECVSESRNFPSADNANDKLITIGAVVSKIGAGFSPTAYERKWVAQLGTTTVEAVPDTTVVQCETEAELIMAFVEFICSERPQILAGYNINEFDFEYIHKRAVRLGLQFVFQRCSMIKNVHVPFIASFRSSAALGELNLSYYEIPGIVVIDLLGYMKRQFKLRSYSLKNVALEFLPGLAGKDDLKPNDIFDYFGQTADHRAIIAKYCVQDCFLVNQLMERHMVIGGEGAIANVCRVPFSYIFFRAQTIKTTTLFDRFARICGYVVRSMSVGEGSEYEGATVWQALVGIYNEPVNVNDFNSLYPSSAISHNISPDTYVGTNVGVEERAKLGAVEEIRVSEGVSHYYRKSMAGAGVEEGRGIFPRMEMYLLRQRAKYKKLMAAESDPVKRQIYNGIQNAYKLTANSGYGALGTNTCPMYHIQSAESITAVGRSLIKRASEIALAAFPGCVVVYGDTDSLFIKFAPPPLADGEVMSFDSRLMYSIECGRKLESVVSSQLPYPHKFAYEKTYYPFILFAKKRYVGAKYEDNPAKFKQDDKGIVLSRRDNAPIVGKIYNGILKYILNQRDGTISNDMILKYIRGQIADVMAGKYPIEDFVISKNLRSGYKDPDSIAHNVLTMRMKMRQPGSECRVNDRVEFCYVKLTPAQLRANIEMRLGKSPAPGTKPLQGDIIESPDYIRAVGLKLDYQYYIEHQFKSPFNQLLSLILFNKSVDESTQVERELDRRIWDPIIGMANTGGGIAKFFGAKTGAV